MRKYSLLLVLLVFAFLPLSMNAQVEDFQEIKDDIQLLQQRADFAYERAQDVTTSDSINRGTFFTITNPGLWGLWVVLCIALMLLLAIRRNILELFSRRLDKKVSDGMHAHISKKPEGGATPASHSKKKLVKPVKTVKIKVRKLAKKK